MSRYITVILLIAVAAGLSALRHAGQISPDLLALWMAGEAFASGDLANIYAPASDVFTMRPPEPWIADLRAQGYDGPVYPFIYPPLWAWAAGLLTQITGYATVVSAANILNPVLLGLMILCAARLAGGRLPPVVFVAIGLLAFSQTTIALVDLEQNQPQILVAFLTLVAIERAQCGKPTQGGLALAIAASIKLYPAFFALFWLAKGERRATAAFAIVGGALGLASIAVAGWPLHAEFLAHIRAISGTVFVTVFNHALDPVIGDIAFSDAMTRIPRADATSDASWTVMTKPALWSALNLATLAAAIAALFLLARRTSDPLFWPLAFTALALLSPLSWGYHYLASIAFLPGLFARLSPGAAIVVTALVLTPTSVLYTVSDGGPLPFMVWGNTLATLAMIVWSALCLTLVTGRSHRHAANPTPA